MEFHGARFSNYEAWLTDPINIKPSAQVVWPIVGQDILNADVGVAHGIQITSGLFHVWRSAGFTNSFQLYCTAIGGLVAAALMLFAGWFTITSALPNWNGSRMWVDAEPPPSWVTRFGLTGLGRSPDSRFFAD